MARPQILVIIPARGGSKGIPRKCLRPLNGQPLIYYGINTSLNSSFRPDVYVTSDDDEILFTAEKIGAKTYKRPAYLGDDKTTLDPVIFDAFDNIQKLENKHYDLVVTLQPTSPILKTSSLDSAISYMNEKADIQTTLSGREDTHLTWKIENGRFVPNYKARVNRQFLPSVYRETGGFLITRANLVQPNNRIGSNVHLHLLAGGEEIDIDTFEDWSLCEYILKKKRILFCVSGNSEIGLGHVYNTLILAGEILDHHVEFLVDKNSTLAKEKIAANNYPVFTQKSDDLTLDIIDRRPDIVINDRLDTTADEILKIKRSGVTVINFEDLGTGARNADLVINAIYPEEDIQTNHYFGHNYVLLRHEFTLAKQHIPKPKVKNILVTFGGVDSNNYTHKVLSTIEKYCSENEIEIHVVAGIGYNQYDSLKNFKKINVHTNVSNISQFMENADLIFTSAGRTTYEIASIGVPAIVMAQNSRELTHFFANEEYGFLNLGMGTEVSNDVLFSRFKKVCEDEKIRTHMSYLMKQTDLRSGRQRVLELVRNALSKSLRLTNEVKE